MKVFLNKLLWSIAIINLFLSSALVAWQLSAATQFGYPLWYEVLNIDEFIKEFGPQNYYKKGFEHTTPADHRQLFKAIVNAIQHQGKDLEHIRYSYQNDTQSFSNTLLRPPEVQHLKDVAILVDKLLFTGAFAVTISLLSIAILIFRNSPLPPTHHIILGFILFLMLTGLTIGIVGLKTVFYYFHTWVFPPENPWFFYYQESLMTTLMHAPQLFGYISLYLSLLTCSIFLLMLWVLHKTIGQKTHPKHPLN